MEVKRKTERGTWNPIASVNMDDLVLILDYWESDECGHFGTTYAVYFNKNQETDYQVFRLDLDSDTWEYWSISDEG